MARKRRGAGSSLDLLLDTICNTFGGVVFISILVVVLLRMTSQARVVNAPTAEAQAELVALDGRRDQAAAKLKSLREAAAQQQRIVRQIAKPENETLFDELQDLKSRRDLLDEQRLNSLGSLSQSQVAVNQVAAQLETLDRLLKDAPPKLAALEAELKAEIDRRAQDARLPLQRNTDKIGFPLLLRGGRLHSVYVISASGSFVFNSGECEMTTALGVKEVLPKPGAGAAVEDTDGSRQALAERLAGLESDDTYITVFIWPDSFAQFRLLKDVLVARRFEYRLVPMTEDGKVVIGVPSTMKVKVQ